MRIGVCILFEGRFAEGAAALINSLYRWGFRGRVFCGVRGGLPVWLEGERSHEPVVDLELVTIRVDYEGPLVWSKARFVLNAWSDVARECEVLYYFDADILVVGPWRIFESWASDGVAICADVNPEMPAGHPFRKVWRELLDPTGGSPVRPLETYFNAGFFGLPRRLESFLERWLDFNKVFRRLEQEPEWRNQGGARHPLSAHDQDAFNAALMLTDVPLSPMGRDGMGFQWGGGSYVMAHAVGDLKPWSACLFAQALRRRRPSLASREFVANLDGPVEVCSPARRRLRRVDLALARALGALVGA